MFILLILGIMSVIAAFKEFVHYLRYPTFGYKRSAPLSLMMITKLYFLVFAVEMLIFLPVSQFLGLEDLPHAMTEVMDKWKQWQVFVLAVIAAPLAEEFIFRYHLRYKSLCFLFVLIVLATLGYMIAGSLGDTYALAIMDGDTLGTFHVPRAFLVILGFSFVLLNIYFISERFKGKADKFIATEFAAIFYVTAFMFAFVHIFNFQLDMEKWYLAPLLVIPQFILALYLGYVRIRNDIYHSIYVHALNNAIPMLLLYVGSLAGVQQ